MSNHMSKKAMELFSRQKEAGKDRRVLKDQARADSKEQYLVRWIAARSRALYEVKVRAVYVFGLFVYIAAMVLAYLWWLT